MKILTLYVILIALIGFATSGLGELIQWNACTDPAGTNSSNTCTVHQVDVHPCKQAARQKPCVIRKGRDASISFDFTPNFSGGDLQTRAYWAAATDIPFIGMNTDACSGTPCPATSGTRQTYNYTLPIGSGFPTNTYDVKWKLWNAEEKECCFIFKIKLV